MTQWMRDKGLGVLLIYCRHTPFYFESLVQQPANRWAAASIGRRQQPANRWAVAQKDRVGHAVACSGPVLAWILEREMDWKHTYKLLYNE